MRPLCTDNGLGCVELGPFRLAGGVAVAGGVVAKKDERRFQVEDIVHAKPQ